MRPESVVSSPPVEQKVSIAAYAWVVLAVAYFASVVSAYTFLAVPPLMPSIIGRYNVDLSSAGLTMAVFSFVGLVLSLPAGWVLKKYGIKVVGILAMLVIVVGCALDAVATTFPQFLLGRGLQGVGFTFIAIMGMTTAGLWFPPQKVSLAMGLLGTCVGVGGFAAMATIPRIVAAAGPAGVWWISAILSVVSVLAVAIFVKMPPWVLAAAAAAKDAQQAAGNPPAAAEGYSNRNIWLLAGTFCMLGLPAYALLTFYITFLNKVRGMTLESAGSIGGLMMIGMLIGSPVSGIVLAKLGHLKLSLIAVSVAQIVLVCTGFAVTGAAIPVWAFLMGAVGMGFVQVVCSTAIPGIMGKPELIGVGIGIYMLGVNAAGIIGAPLMGSIVQRTSWNTAGCAMVPVIVIAIITTWLTKFAE